MSVQVFGWRDDPVEVQRVVATLPFPTATICASHLSGTGEDKTVLLWEAAIKATGNHLPAHRQPRGTCVSRGFARAVDYVQCVEIAMLGEPEEFKSVSHAVVYGLCKEVGGDIGPQNQSERGDGAVGAWAAKAVSMMGNIDRVSVKDEALDSDTLAIQYAVSGVPASVKDLAKSHLIKAATLVESVEQARDFICNGYPLSCCSSQGFTMTRDSEGRCRPQGQWNHCMMWPGYDKEKRRFCVDQSWGQNTPDGPIYLNQPTNSFWIDWDVADRMIRARDTFALSAFDGFPAREISWLM